MLRSLSDWGLMTMSQNTWLIRFGIGSVIFAILLAIDLRKHGRQSQRLREYSFLIAAVLIGVAYGAVNDLITATISWEYFYYGKDLAASLGPTVPPGWWALHLAAMRIGGLASGSAALIGGAILLATNSISPRATPPLQIRGLLQPLAGAWLITILFAAVLGFVGYAGGLAWMSADLQGIVRDHLFRPQRFLCVYGIHLGAYVGGVIGTVVACMRIGQERRRTSRHGKQSNRIVRVIWMLHDSAIRPPV